MQHFQFLKFLFFKHFQNQTSKLIPPKLKLEVKARYKPVIS